ncbi:MAG: hypothetical protein ACFFA3_07900 [Promethearchaeota archaeon]
MSAQYSSSMTGNKKTSRACCGIIFIIIGIVIVAGPFSFYIGTASTFIATILILVGVILLLAAASSKQGYFNRTGYDPIEQNLYKRFDRCPKCGTKRSPGYKICFYCGYRFYGEKISSIPQPAEVTSTPSHESTFPPISELLQSKGSPYENAIPEIKVDDYETAPLIPEEKNKIVIKFCPQCGEKFLQGAKFCFICGKKVGDVESSLSIPEIEKKEIKIISSPVPPPIVQVSDIEKEEIESITTPESPPRIQITEIKKEEIETPEISPMTQTSKLEREVSKIITPEILEPIPSIPDKKATKRKHLTCNFCGIKLPENAPFCIQCGMIIKTR